MTTSTANHKFQPPEMGFLCAFCNEGLAHPNHHAAMNIHPDDMPTLERARELANRLAASIGQTCTLEPKRRPHPMSALGLCYCAEKRIAITFRYQNPKTGWHLDPSQYGKWRRNPLPWAEVAETVAHEVAHLIHANHSPAFRALERELISKI